MEWLILGAVALWALSRRQRASVDKSGNYGGGWNGGDDAQGDDDAPELGDKGRSIPKVGKAVFDSLAKIGSEAPVRLGVPRAGAMIHPAAWGFRPAWGTSAVEPMDPPNVWDQYLPVFVPGELRLNPLMTGERIKKWIMAYGRPTLVPGSDDFVNRPVLHFDAFRDMEGHILNGMVFGVNALTGELLFADPLRTGRVWSRARTMSKGKALGNTGDIIDIPNTLVAVYFVSTGGAVAAFLYDLTTAGRRQMDLGLVHSSNTRMWLGYGITADYQNHKMTMDMAGFSGDHGVEVPSSSADLSKLLGHKSTEFDPDWSTDERQEWISTQWDRAMEAKEMTWDEAEEILLSVAYEVAEEIVERVADKIKDWARDIWGSIVDWFKNLFGL